MEIATAAPDLRFMTKETHQEVQAIVLDGVRAEAGMAGFGDFLTEAQMEYIRAYLVAEANNLRGSQSKTLAEREADRRG